MANDVEEVVKKPPVEVDLNNLELADEQVDVNPDADAFSGPPPPDDGDHRFKLKLGPRKVQQGEIGKGVDKGKKFYMVHVQGQISDPQDKHNGRTAFDNVSTMVMQGNGTSRIVGALKSLGETISVRESILDLARRFKARLDGEPEVTWQTQWTAFCKTCKEEADRGSKKVPKNGIILRGQKNFPQLANGSHQHQIECKNCGSLLTANSEVLAWKALPQ